MEGVLNAALRLCVCKLMSSVLLCPSVVTHTITAVSLCCSCLLLFTDLAVTLFLLCVWLLEFWMTPFSISSDVVALRFLLFLCQAYGVVLLLTPPLIAVELLVQMLHAQDEQMKGRLVQNEKESNRSECLPRTVGLFGCLLAWMVSGIHCGHDWMLERLSVEGCLKTHGCLVVCLPNVDELSWVVPAMVVLLSVSGSLGFIRMKASENTQMGELKDHVVLERMHMSQTAVDSEKTPNSCGVRKAGFVYCQPRWFCPGNDVLCTHQTGLADGDIQKQKQSTNHAMFAQSKPNLPLEVTSAAVKTQKSVFNRPHGRHCWLHERESPCLGRETFIGLVCVILVCLFPTVVSGNILLIFNLENVVAYSLKLLSQSANRVPDLLVMPEKKCDCKSMTSELPLIHFLNQVNDAFMKKRVLFTGISMNKHCG